MVVMKSGAEDKPGSKSGAGDSNAEGLSWSRCCNYKVPICCYRCYHYLISVLMKQYRSRRKQVIILSMTAIICFIYYYLDVQVEMKHQFNITRKIIEDELRDALKEDKGTGCQIPYLDPFAKEITQFDEALPEITCGAQDWVKCYFSECRIVEEILKTTKDIVCYYQDIIFVDDNNFQFGPVTEVVGDKPYVLEKSDHVKIKCTGTSGTWSNLSFLKLFAWIVNRSSWVGYALGFRKSVERKPVPPNRQDTLNVLIFGIDSTSKNLFIRRMPKSYDYLKNHIQFTTLNGYNIVGDGTPAALFPILTGKTELELPDVRKISGTNAFLDSMPFIFYKLKEDGYRTAYFEDMPSIGTFQYRFTGFRHQPADHYLRAVSLLEYYDTKSWYCRGDTPHFKVMINITDQFLQLDGKKFCFTFLVSISHDDFNLISTADEALVNFLKTLVKRNIFEDTLVMVMSDHGSRFSKFRNTLQGKLEERLPFMSIRLPDKLKRSRSHAQAMLEQNAEALTTPHDIYATILDVLDWSQHMNPYKVVGADFPRGMSLLKPIPRNRSCSEAGIQPHWCACVVWNDLTSDDSMFHRTAEAFIEYINELTESVRALCVPRKLIEIEWVLRQRPNKRMLSFIKAQDADGYVGEFGPQTNIIKEIYQLKVLVGPDQGLYEASMVYLKNEDRFLMDSTDISRTNAYGDEPSCISATHPHLNMYCYCKDHVSQRV